MAIQGQGAGLRPVVRVIEENCVNCHRCIAVCPVKMANDGSGDHVRINGDLCIGCGECIDACTHGAREGIDDAEAFFGALARREKIVAIVAPAVVSSFPDDYLRLNSFLAQMGVSAFFDVSFGAELTVKSYLEYKKEHNPKTIIAQPCPTLVTFIELYRPELIPYLAPADSPMLHTIKMIREYYPLYSSYKVAVLSPCFSKRREFDETGIGDYNVTFRSLSDYIRKKGVVLSEYPEKEYDNPPAERAVLFSTPGGLMRTIERSVAGASEITRKIEGHPQVFHFLAHMSEAIKTGAAPLHQVVDCLNCELGCNGGPGTNNRGKHADVIEQPIEQRNRDMQKQYRPKGVFKFLGSNRKKLDALINQYWKKGLYDRSYVDRSSVFRTAIKRPSDADIQSCFASMHKKTKADILNCGACGYNSCEQMAVAIYNGLNRVENCRHYMAVEVANLHEEHKREVSQAIQTVAAETAVRLQTNMQDITTLANGTTDMASCVTQSSASIEEMVANIQSINQTLQKNAETVIRLEQVSTEGQGRINEIVTIVTDISEQSESLAEASSIIKQIASRTNLLAMNAAIEAAHAGTVGQGFAVVADEIRKLAENAGSQASSISKALKSIKELIDNTASKTQEAQGKFDQIVDLTQAVRNEEQVIKDSITEQSVGGRQVLEALTRMNDLTAQVRDETGSLLQSSKFIMDDISRLSEMSSTETTVVDQAEFEAAYEVQESNPDDEAGEIA